MKLVKKIFLLIVFSAIFTMGVNSVSNEVKSGKLWVGVSYGMAEQGHSNGMIAAVGVGGVLQSGLYGAAVGGPIGAGVGIFIGL